MENQYGQSGGKIFVDKAIMNNSVSQSHNFEIGKKNSVPVNNSRRRQAGHSLVNDPNRGLNQPAGQKMPHLVEATTSKPQ